MVVLITPARRGQGCQQQNCPEHGKLWLSTNPVKNRFISSTSLLSSHELTKDQSVCSQHCNYSNARGANSKRDADALEDGRDRVDEGFQEVCRAPVQRQRPAIGSSTSS